MSDSSRTSSRLRSYHRSVGGLCPGVCAPVLVHAQFAPWELVIELRYVLEGAAPLLAHSRADFTNLIEALDFDKHLLRVT